MKRLPHFPAVILVICICQFAIADSTISPASKFAYSANAGWINFRHDKPSSPSGIVFGEFFVSGFAYGANFGWMDFGDGTPANGIQYLNNAATDYGVNHDGLGNLSGYAYGANIGWIHFGWTNTSDPNRPRVSLLTGGFSGYAYSANVGWINLGTGNLVTNSMRIIDTDGDGIADAWERTYFGNLSTATLTSDFDKDGATDKNEYISGTTPNNNADYFKIISTTYNGFMTQATVVFTTDATRHYRLETSDNVGPAPGDWTGSIHGTFAPNAGLSTSKIISWPGTTKKFIRAVAVRPLP
jgi:hypothetical protein